MALGIARPARADVPWDPGPRELGEWTEGMTIPPGYRKVQRTNWELVAHGLGIFGVGYVSTAAIATPIVLQPGSARKWWPLYLPLGGPLVTIDTADVKSAGGILALTLPTVVQGVGLAILTGGLLSPKEFVVRSDVAAMRLGVGAVGSGSGVRVVGTFD